MRKLLGDVPGDEENLMEGVGAAVSKGGGKTALVTESVNSNTIVDDSVGGRMRRQLVDQEDIRRVLCRAATIGEFFRLLSFIAKLALESTAFLRDLMFLFQG